MLISTLLSINISTYTVYKPRMTCQKQHRFSQLHHCLSIYGNNDNINSKLYFIMLTLFTKSKSVKSNIFGVLTV